MVSNMAISTGDALIYDSNTPGGFRFLNHASDATSLAKINSNSWDYVVLQAQSQEAAWIPAQMEVDLYPYNPVPQILVELIYFQTLFLDNLFPARQAINFFL